MTSPKRKIRAKPFLRDIRNGLSNVELMEKYILSERQLSRVFQRLVDAGAIDEVELFIRTSLDDSPLIEAFVETRRDLQQRDNLGQTAPSHDLEASSEITVTEKIKTLGKVARGIVSKLARTG